MNGQQPSGCGCAWTSTPSRRQFLGSAAVATVGALAGLTVAETATAAGARGEERGWVDVNVSLGRWPMRRLPDDEPERLAARFRSRGIEEAWAGSLDGLLAKDLATVNLRLTEDCRRSGRKMFLPFGSINPKRPGWERDLEQCVAKHRMPGVRLHPNYHGYRLDDPDLVRLLKLATERELIVQLAFVMEDERMMHPLLRVEPVDPAPLAEVVRQTPGLRLVLLNALRTLRRDLLRSVASSGNVSVEISMLEGVGGVGGLLEQVPLGRVLFGSHAPMYYFESAELKLRESALTPEQRRAVLRENARRLLAGVGPHYD